MAWFTIFRQLEQLTDTFPVWLKIVIGIFFLSFSIVSVYGRININFGNKIFSRIPKDQIRTNLFHIFQYTIIPVLVTVYYFYLAFF